MFEKHTRGVCGNRNLSNKIMKRHGMIRSEVFVWISARLRFHKKTFPLDFQSEISKAEVNFSVKSVSELKCSHNFRNCVS